jgi:hypothetical protein
MENNSNINNSNNQRFYENEAYNQDNIYNPNDIYDDDNQNEDDNQDDEDNERNDIEIGRQMMRNYIYIRRLLCFCGMLSILTIFFLCGIYMFIRAYNY